ncbi:hypothetical protein APUTEX25_001422 [Auxenochlorella protothecoides]|uniref:Fe2OG dioxygenase domain-containing protein n=1 Tax=Auxenochlorella protothecoides TaxID=3075 RepID=A0A3M7L3I7_AUXPR|nr:hypothetical protein APUTEX25_001422 [Auxenochlorella protothecoides]|eukprot:RMZ56575.1 hypothetical protein APUTEX25_001422 [Auxenochlorella protothecoides]
MPVGLVVPATEISGRDLFTVTEVLSSKEASCIVEYAESLGLTHQSSRGPKFGEAFRDNDRVSIQDQAWADTLWTALGLQGTLGRDPTTGAQPVGLNPNLRFYRYRPGQRFGRHIDESNDLGGGKFTLYTVLIYLSTPGEGGETVFYNRGKRLAAVSPGRAWRCCIAMAGTACCMKALSDAFDLLGSRRALLVGTAAGITLAAGFTFASVLGTGPEPSQIGRPEAPSRGSIPDVLDVDPILSAVKDRYSGEVVSLVVRGPSGDVYVAENDEDKPSQLRIARVDARGERLARFVLRTKLDALDLSNRQLMQRIFRSPDWETRMRRVGPGKSDS